MMLQSTSQQPGDTAPFLLFRVRQYLCALPLEHVVETMRPLPVSAIAGVPDVVLGLAVIRGEPVPVVDLGLFLDGAGESSARFITVRSGQNHVALAVDSVVGLHYLSARTLKGVPSLLGDADEHAVAAIGTLDSELLMVLDTAHLVPESLWQAISAAGDDR